MPKPEFSCHEVYILKDVMPYLNDHIGERMILGGKGLLDGLKLAPSKSMVVTICGLSDGKPYFRQFGRHKLVYVAEGFWDQECRFVSEKEYKKLPRYA